MKGRCIGISKPTVADSQLWEMSKPTALAAFAIKQQRVELLDGLSKTETGSSPGRTLARRKVPSLKTLGGIGDDVGATPTQPTKPTFRGSSDVLMSPVKPLKVLSELRTSGDARGSSSHKLGVLNPVSPLKATKIDKTSTDSNVEPAETRNATIAAPSPRTVKAPRGSSLKPLAPTDSDSQGQSGADGAVQKVTEKIMSKAADEVAESKADTLSTQDEATKTKSIVTGSMPPADGDKSDDEDFNFDDSDGEKEGVKKPTTQPVESPPPSSTEARPAMVDVEDLYDCPLDEQERAHREPKMFLPRVSDIELFHVVLTADSDRLEQFLEEISPQDMLGIVDTTGRTLYHYGALSKDKLVQEMIFQHVNFYRDTQFKIELQALMRKKELMNTESIGSGWVPPRVKELQRETTKQKCDDWASICSSRDENGRSLFHYIATTTSLIPIADDYEFCSVLRTQPSILCTKDKFKKLALHYAVQAGNLKLVKWFFQIGIKLNQADVDLLLSFNVSRVMESVILRQLEAMDIRNYYLSASIDENDDRCDPGVSTFALAKLQRITDDSVGRLHQLLIHRAAMFGNIRAVELLLEEGADPNARDANLWTPLHYCADEATANHLSVAQLLMEAPKSVDVNAKSLKGRSPLHVAVRSRKRVITDDSQPTKACESKDRLSFVSYLNEHKADLNLKDASGATPLLLACRGDDVGVARFLLRAGCDPTATGDNKWSPLHLAAIRGNPSMVAFLLSWDADSRLWIDSPGILGKKPVDLANSDSVRQMLVNLWIECYNGNVDHVRCLLLARSKRGLQPFEQVESVSVKDKTVQAERTPLHLAILGYADVLQSPKTSSNHISSHEERIKQVKTAERKRTAPSRFLQIAVLLLQAGADMCAADKWEITPLMLAASIKDTIFMETLLDRISDEDGLSVTDVDGNTALHYSYAFCQAQISTMLEDQMDDADIDNKQGKSPFEMTGYRDKIYRKEYREFLRQQQNLRRRSRS